MEERKARAMFPVWSEDDDVKRYRPDYARPEKRNQKAPREVKNTTSIWTGIVDAANGFIRRNLIAILVLTAFALEGWIVAVYTEHKVSREVRQTVEAEMRQSFAVYLEEQEQKRQAANLLTGDASLQAAIDAMVEPVARHIAGLRMDRGVTVNGAKTYVWGVDFSRLASGKYGRTIEEVLAGNIEGYKEDHAVRQEDRDISRELCTAYMHGERPNKWTPDLEFAEINADGSVTARNKLKTDSTTRFWGYEE
jgi:hypothetical protein